MHEKYKRLTEMMQSLGSVAVAFSGGVDSSLLLYAASGALGDRAVALTAVSDIFLKRESAEAKEFCESRGIRQIIVDFRALEIKDFSGNPENRCYICKRELFRKFIDTAHKLGIDCVAEGTNTDDAGDYRPGMAAVRELGVLSPLRQAGLSKGEIRKLSRGFGLPTWDKPSRACLASRFVYGETISAERLMMVERAEQLLFDMGFWQARVRVHGEGKQTQARIEVLPEDIGKLAKEENRAKIYEYLKEIGFTYVSADLGGYRTGSMNEAVDAGDI